jgi:hypothetical protein
VIGSIKAALRKSVESKNYGGCSQRYRLCSQVNTESIRVKREWDDLQRPCLRCGAFQERTAIDSKPSPISIDSESGFNQEAANNYSGSTRVRSLIFGDPKRHLCQSRLGIKFVAVFHYGFIETSLLVHIADDFRVGEQHSLS